MTSHVQIYITGAGFNKRGVLGATLTYGINMVPIAIIELDGSFTDLLCDFEKYRREPLSIDIQTINGCMRFDGLIDGLSFNQNMGSVAAQLVVKGKFQTLMEIYGRLPGLHPDGLNIFESKQCLNINTDGNLSNNFFAGIDLVNYGLNLNPDTNVISFFLETMKIALKVQQSLANNITTPNYNNENMTNLVEILNKVSGDKLIQGLELLDKIDTTYTDGMQLLASDSMVSGLVIQQITQGLAGNLLDSYMGMLSQYGCALIIGNDKIFTIPETGYIRVPKDFSIPVGAVSSKPNILYPGQFNALSFNDGGYKDIKAVYVVSDDCITTTNDNMFPDVGVYIDPDPNAKGGVLALSLPTFMAFGMDNQAVITNKSLTNKIRDQVAPVIPNATADEQQQVLDNFKVKQTEDSNRIKRDFTDNWAQMRYCQAKYGDRNGSVHSFFWPKWAPGAVGTVYTRYPGTFVDFLVTSVTHRFVVSTPNGGEASTTASFNCGRVGKSTSLGVDTLLLYDYSYEQAAAFARDFVDDITV